MLKVKGERCYLKQYSYETQPKNSGVFAPRLPFTGRSESYTFADILETFGFGNPDLLKSHILAWQSIIKEVKPSLIITDHAPGLVLAAKNIVPTIIRGDAFTVPPPVEIFPNLRIPAPFELGKISYAK